MEKNTKKLYNKWVKFNYERKKDECLTQENPHFISMIDREKLIDILFEKLNKYEGIYAI